MVILREAPISLGVIHKWHHGITGWGQGFCDNSTKTLLLKSVTMGGGGRMCQKLRDVIYERSSPKNDKKEDGAKIKCKLEQN